MFGLFSKTTKKDKLEKQYTLLLQQSHQLSRTNRAESDRKFAEAHEVMLQLEKLEVE